MGVPATRDPFLPKAARALIVLRLSPQPGSPDTKKSADWGHVTNERLEAEAPF